MKRFLFFLPYLLIAAAVVIIVIALNHEASKIAYPLDGLYGR